MSKRARDSPATRSDNPDYPSYLQAVHPHSPCSLQKRARARKLDLDNIDVAPASYEPSRTANTSFSPALGAVPVPMPEIRARKSFSKLSDCVKFRDASDLLKVCGGDLPGAIKFMAPKLASLCASAGINAPGRLQEEVVEAFKESFPSKTTASLPIKQALQLQSDLLLSDAKYELLHRSDPSRYPPLQHLRDECKRTDPRLVAVTDENNNVLAYAVDDISALIVGELEYLMDHWETDERRIPKCIRELRGMHLEQNM